MLPAAPLSVTRGADGIWPRMGKDRLLAARGRDGISEQCLRDDFVPAGPQKGYKIPRLRRSGQTRFSKGSRLLKPDLPIMKLRWYHNQRILIPIMEPPSSMRKAAPKSDTAFALFYVRKPKDDFISSSTGINNLSDVVLTRLCVHERHAESCFVVQEKIESSRACMFAVTRETISVFFLC